MNAIFLRRLTQAALWIGVSAAFWLLHMHQLGQDASLALLVAGVLTAMIKLAQLIIFRGQPANMDDRLTTLGGLLAGFYGQRE
jgi:uncharacterized protein YhhL (DUF1145 family)